MYEGRCLATLRTLSDAVCHNVDVMGRRALLSVLIAAIVCTVGGLAIRTFGDDMSPVDLRDRADVHVNLGEQGFDPRDILIRSGTRVTFTTSRDKKFWPASNSHPLHNLYPLFDPKEPIEPTDTWSFTFNDPGAWGYHDHMRSYFTGTIYVD